MKSGSKLSRINRLFSIDIMACENRSSSIAVAGNIFHFHRVKYQEKVCLALQPHPDLYC